MRMKNAFSGVPSLCVFPKKACVLKPDAAGACLFLDPGSKLPFEYWGSIAMFTKG